MVVDRHRLAAYHNKHCWRSFRGYQHRWLWTILNPKNWTDSVFTWTLSCFCQNIIKVPPLLIILAKRWQRGYNYARCTYYYGVKRWCSTLLHNAVIISTKLLIFAWCIMNSTENATWFNNFVVFWDTMHLTPHLQTAGYRLKKHFTNVSA